MMMHIAVLLVSFVLQSNAQVAAPLDAMRFQTWNPKILTLLDQAPYYLKREELLALADAVAPPPANSSPETRKELDELLALQKAITPAQKRAIGAHLNYRGTCDAIIADIHRALSHAPKTRALLAHIERDASLAVFHTKKKWMRARPHQLDANIKPAIPVPGHPAYPSAHAIFGHVAARTLGEIFPDYREGLIAAGKQIGREREIAGVHFPSDGTAGRALGDAVFERLLKNDEFQKDLSMAMGEWTCAGQ